MKDKAGQKRDKARHVPNCPSDEAGQDRTTLYELSGMSRLSQKLAGIHSIDELYGFANRRKVLNITDDNIAPAWTDEERALIVERKYQLMKGTKR